MVYMFILTTYLAGGITNVNVEQMNMTGEGCIALMEQYNEDRPDWGNGIPSCEFQVEFVSDPD